MKSTFKGKTILVTGGCGSIGTEIVKQVLKHEPEVIRVLDNNEDGHFRLGQEINSDKIRPLIGDIRDRDRINRAMEGVDIVFHAAALKHVPFCEYNPFEAVNTNVHGTKNLVDAAIAHNVERFVGISTDKAVNPINTMGATKLLSEKIITNAPIGKSSVKFCCVRFGNVLDSNGSVIPIFRKQIEEGKPITLTSPDMTRFFMGLKDAVKLVLKAAEIVESGETFILKMESLKIKDLAEVLVEELSLEHGTDPKDVKYEIIGMRPGEKLHEALVTEEEAEYVTEIEDMFILRSSLLSNYGKNQKKNKDSRRFTYDSGNVKHLTKDQITKRLREQGII